MGAHIRPAVSTVSTISTVATVSLTNSYNYTDADFALRSRVQFLFSHGVCVGLFNTFRVFLPDVEMMSDARAMQRKVFPEEHHLLYIWILTAYRVRVFKASSG